MRSLAVNQGSANHFRSGDAIRLVATIAVIGIHAIRGEGPDDFTGQAAAAEWPALLIKNLCSWAVPVFVLLSGALLLHGSKDESFSTFYRKRLSRIGLPLIAWSIIYLWWRSLKDPAMCSVAEFGRAILMGKPYVHLHFLFIIAGLYVFVPFLRVLLRQLSYASMLYLTALVLAITTMSQITDIVLRQGPEPQAFTRFLPYLGYFLAGHAIRSSCERQHDPPAPPWWTALGLAVATGIFCIGIFALHLAPNADARLPRITATLGYTAMSILVFMFLCRPWFYTCHWFSWLAAAVGPCTLGVYLIHPLFLSCEARYCPMWDWANGLTGSLCRWGLAFWISLATVWVARKVKVLRLVLG